MIDRYTLPEMGRVWSDQHKYELWCRVETLVLEAHAAAGRVPADVVEPVRNAPPPTPERVAEIEETTQHDVIAFLTAWADNTEPRSAAAYVHHGMTSSDLLDTALAGQRTEVRELSEAFGAGQKGSSAMPHKKNPIRSERIAGLARVVRAAVVPVMEGIPLWHERDISHSSTERVFLPDAAITTDYLLELTTGLVENLVVDADRMLLVASDRISAYDHVLPTPIPDKGRVLTALSVWWFDQLAPVLAEFGASHHLVSAVE